MLDLASELRVPGDLGDIEMSEFDVGLSLKTDLI